MGLLRIQAVVRRKCSTGFTLIEMMITVILMAIVVNLVMPLEQVAEAFKLDYLNQRIYSSAALARSEAIKRAEIVSVCQSDAGVACDAGANWANGWVIFVNPNNNNAIDAGEEIIRVYNQVNSPVNITWDSGQRLTFIPRGSPVAQGTFTLCPRFRSNPVPQRRVNITGSGLVQKRTGGGNCP